MPEFHSRNSIGSFAILLPKRLASSIVSTLWCLHRPLSSAHRRKRLLVSGPLHHIAFKKGAHRSERQFLAMTRQRRWDSQAVHIFDQIHAGQRGAFGVTRSGLARMAA